MKAIKEDYLLVQMARGEHRRAPGVLQVAWPHLIGHVYAFTNPESFEEVRKHLILEGAVFVTVPDTGIMVQLDGSLVQFDERKIDDFDKQVRAVLFQMGMEYWNSMAPGKQRFMQRIFQNRT